MWSAYMQAVKWRFHGRFDELVATDAERFYVFMAEICVTNISLESVKYVAIYYSF
jgi:hypothetical protein